MPNEHHLNDATHCALRENKMTAKTNRPAIRFQGFKDEWEEKRLGDITYYLKGFAFKAMSYRSDGIPIIRVSDLSENSIKNNTEKVFISFNEAKDYEIWEIHKNDILVTTVGSKPQLVESAVGRAIFINENNTGLLNQNLLILRNSDKNFENRFIYCQMKSKAYLNHIETIQRGNANQSNITVTDLGDFQFCIPKIKEQTTIAAFFRHLDELLARLQAQHSKTQQFKQAMLGKMFPVSGSLQPEIRLQGFSGDWVERKLGEICEKVIEKNQNRDNG